MKLAIACASGSFKGAFTHGVLTALESAGIRADAYDIPAWINEKPYIDASYTCMCPAIEMIDAGYKQVIAISNEPGIFYRDMFGKTVIRENYQGIDIHIIKPDIDLKEMGVDFTNATPEGLLAVYQHGQEKGKEFLANWGNS